MVLPPNVVVTPLMTPFVTVGPAVNSTCAEVVPRVWPGAAMFTVPPALRAKLANVRIAFWPLPGATLTVEARS